MTHAWLDVTPGEGLPREFRSVIEIHASTVRIKVELAGAASSLNAYIIEIEYDKDFWKKDCT